MGVPPVGEWRGGPPAPRSTAHLRNGIMVCCIDTTAATIQKTTRPETMNTPFRIVLFAPEIPQNTGTIGRLCVCCGAELHLIEPLGFEVTETRLRRAGLDYWRHLTWHVHPSWSAFVDDQAPERLFFATAHARRTIYQTAFRTGDWLVFGNETGGLPQTIHEQYAENMRTIPMPGEHARTHNLANAVAIVLHEALRQSEGW